MLDDLRVLRDAVKEYRAASAAAGLDWPAAAELPSGQAPDLVFRLFDVDHVAEQLTWLESQDWPPRRLLPGGGWLVPWPTDGGEALYSLSLSIGTPFPWRHQIPLFQFERVLYTFVLAGNHEGEIWRYEVEPDNWSSVRAATSLAALFTVWTKGVTAGVVFVDGGSGWLQVGDGVQRAVDILLEQVPDLDPLAFPVSTLSKQSLLRQRQRECGVDMACIDRGFECQEELAAAIDAAQASLGL